MPDAKGPVSDSTARLLFVVDLVGIFVFALEGALAGMAGALDLLGVMVLAFWSACGSTGTCPGWPRVHEGV